MQQQSISKHLTIVTFYMIYMNEDDPKKSEPTVKIKTSK